MSAVAGIVNFADELRIPVAEISALGDSFAAPV
jgi:hypothetical protein